MQRFGSIHSRGRPTSRRFSIQSFTAYTSTCGHATLPSRHLPGLGSPSPLARTPLRRGYSSPDSSIHRHDRLNCFGSPQTANLNYVLSLNGENLQLVQTRPCSPLIDWRAAEPQYVQLSAAPLQASTFVCCLNSRIASPENGSEQHGQDLKAIRESQFSYLGAPHKRPLPLNGASLFRPQLRTFTPVNVETFTDILLSHQ